MRDNFWLTYPDAEAIEVFRTLKEKKGDEASSDIMWYIHCMKDPSNLFLRHLSTKERDEELRKYYSINQKDLVLAYVKKVLEWYVDHWMSPPKRMLNAMIDKYYEAEKLTRSKKIVQEDDILVYANMQKALAVWKTEIDAAEASFRDESTAKPKIGSGSISAADSGEIFDEF